jgi:hypothetical protein
MVSEMLPLRLGSAAARLGVEPFEVVRLLVASGDKGAVHSLAEPRLEALRRYAGIETWWTDPSQIPSDDIAARGVVRGALRQLLDRGFIGETRTRQDNLWRGLPTASRRAVEDALDVLVEFGLLAVRAEPTGQLVSVRPEGAERVDAISPGREIPEELNRTWT